MVAVSETVQQNTNKSDPNSPTGLSGPVNVQSVQVTPGEILQDVPVFILGAGLWYFTFPIQKGDECWLLFSDTEIDNWLLNGTPGPNTPVTPNTKRRHNMSDAMAIFGVPSKPNSPPSYSVNSAQIRNKKGTVVIDLKDEAITITAPSVIVNAATVTVNGRASVKINSGSVTIGKNTTIDGKLFKAHTHSGVTTGGGVSGPVA
jgi:hypothetical protein